ncbi:ATP-dependent DNA ligase [Patescibacteria group bacterium]|nr:ATP-dependent DNA ligase [Patescibacteria group bacterium]
MTIDQLSQYLNKLETTSSRLEITAILSDLLKKLEPAEVRPACYLLQGQLLPQYYGLEFQIAVKTVIKVLARLKPMQSMGTVGLFEESDSTQAEKEVERRYKEVGDLGKVAEETLTQYLEQSSGTSTPLSVVELYELLLDIAKDSGAQSQQRKQDKAVLLFEKLDPLSAKFVVRILLGRLRLGFSDMTIMDALSWAMCGDKSEREMLEAAYQRRADIGQLAAEYLRVDDADARHKLLSEQYTIQLGVPVVPALCQRLNSATEVIEKMHEVIAEPKYDGLRVQIHVEKARDGKPTLLRTFTRNLEESSAMFPELDKVVEKLKCQNCVLDGEAIGYDPQTNQLISFQQTIQRKRKHGVAEKAAEIPVRFYIFDLLYLNGENLIDKPLKERRALLEEVFTDDDVLVHTEGKVTSDPEQLRQYHEQALAEGLEGVVMKQMSSGYQSGRKGWSWVKMKEAEGRKGKLSDTLDVIVMGYYLGRGKRAEFGIGAFLVGVYDEQQQQVLSLAKIGTGLTEETLGEVKRRCDALIVSEQPSSYVVNKALIPDKWCAPELVVEVAADELTTSPIHTAGQALRFPRFIKFRDDKRWDQATTLEELKSIEISK